MITADIVIVGGGPAGSTAAWQLKQAGADVLLIDKAEFPRDKVCAGWITPAIIESLQLDIDQYRQQHTLQEIRGFRTSMLDGNESSTRYNDVVSYGIRRREFDHYLLARSGVRTQLNTRVSDISRQQDRLVINGVIETPLILGAGGHACPVSRFIGNRPGKHERAVSAQELEVRLTPEQQQSCAVQGDQAELFFCRDLKGYAWVFRKGEYLNIGLGREDNHRLPDHIDEFMRYLFERERVPANIETRFCGHAYLLYGHGHRRAIDDGVMLMGDALGLAYPQSGEGIRPAIESAILAVDTIIRANGNYTEASLARYVDSIERRLGKPAANDVPRSSLPWLPGKLKFWLARQAIANPWFARRVIMDNWFLHRAQPALRPVFDSTAAR
ncbi:MAG: NAD(P)/FAD-dependent oxidoreductase [Gammaproteobacteria bacterium]|nr:NAD(P)/FAD-dependent oxidoreductase [Gammaproteobacteria bacterium]